MNDNIIVSHEIMHHMNKKKGNLALMAWKIDMAKTYDHVEWSFLKIVMKHHGFSESFIKLISKCDLHPLIVFLSTILLIGILVLLVVSAKVILCLWHCLP